MYELTMSFKYEVTISTMNSSLEAKPKTLNQNVYKNIYSKLLVRVISWVIIVILKGNVNALIYLQSFRSKIVFNPIRRLDSWKILLLIQVAHLTGRPSSRCLLGGLCCPGYV